MFSYDDEDMGRDSYAEHYSHQLEAQEMELLNRKREYMPYSLELKYKHYPMLTEFLMDQVKFYGVRSMKEIVDRHNEFARLIMCEMREHILDDGLFESIEEDVFVSFKTNSPHYMENILSGIKHHIYSCVSFLIDDIIDECVDYYEMPSSEFIGE